MIINIGGGGTSGHVLKVTTAPGATVTATKGSKIYTATADSVGIATFGKLAKGTWTVTATKGDLTATATVDVFEDKAIAIVLNTIPEFTYEVSAADGGYAIYDADDNDITDKPEAKGDWKIKFFKSGELKFLQLNGASDGIDVFCVGGGGGGSNGGGTDQGAGGGAGSGRTTTGRGITVSAGTPYYITIGSGGGNKGFWDPVSQAGETSAFDVTAEGGYSAHGVAGGNGGSGGSSAHAGPGGTDGKDGSSYGVNYPAGEGQHSTTREFGESNGALYASGGAGGQNGNENGVSAAANTGDGGSGGGDNGGSGGSGGSGIVIIRNKR